MSDDILVYIEHFDGKVSDLSYSLLAQAREVAQTTHSSVGAVLLGDSCADLANGLACDRVYLGQAPGLAAYTWEAYLVVLAASVAKLQPRLVLLGDTTEGAELAAGLSARLALPLISSCRQLTAGSIGLRFSSQTCSGKLQAEGALPGGTIIVAMLPGGFKPEEGKSPSHPPVVDLELPQLQGLHSHFVDIVRPEGEDVDISAAPFLVAVGRGLQREDNLELAQELADALGAVVVGTRPVVDQGWLPATRLVGKSGQTVKPRLYLAFGVSGAPEHTEAISGAELILAVNTDPRAPIFDLAQYGVECDALDLLPALTEAVRAAKGA